jgi:DNA-binding NarL/FixJ family response regulator
VAGGAGRRPPRRRHSAADVSRGAGAHARAQPLLDEIGWLARDHGLRLAGAPAGAPSDVERLGLTSRELEVLEPLAEGASNRQIADALFIPAKTVSVHVSDILAKFGKANRGQAAAAAHRLRLFETGQ